MKKLVLALVFGFATAAHAASSLSPTAYTSGGVNMATSNDAYVEVRAFTTDTLAQTTIITFVYGTATTSGGNTTAFTHDANSPLVIFTINWASAIKTWNYTINTINGQGALNGTLTAGDLTNLNTAMSGGYISLINGFNALAVEKGIFGASSTNYPWTTTPTVN